MTENNNGQGGDGRQASRSGIALWPVGLGLAVVLLPGWVGAETWIGHNNGSWFAEGNWQGGVVPGPETATTEIANHTGVVVSGEMAVAGRLLVIGNPGSQVTVEDGAGLAFGTARLVRGGQLIVNNASISGNIELNNGQVYFDPETINRRTNGTNTLVFDGAIAGDNSAGPSNCPGGLSTCAGVNINSGTVVLTGASSYTGYTAVSDQATLRLANALALRNSLVVLHQNGRVELATDTTIAGLADPKEGGGGHVDLGSATLTLLAPTRNDGSAPQFSGVIEGSGGLVKAGPGTQVLTGENTYTGGTTIGQGVLQVGVGGTQGSLVGAVTNNGGLIFNRSDSLSFSGPIQGTGYVQQQGGGTLLLTGVNTYSGGTQVNAGTLAGNTDSLQGRIFNNARVEFRQAADGTYAGAMSGTGGLVKSGAGTLLLTGANTYGGGTRVDAGTLAGNTASLPGDIVNNARVEFRQAADGTYAGAMSGSGGLVKNGAGMLTLAGTNTYTGATQINEGTLAVNGGGPHAFAGDVFNEAGFVARQTVVEFGGGFVNNGVYTSDQAINQFNDLAVGGSGYIVGGRGDNFIVTGDFANASTRDTRWNTSASNLIFDNAPGGSRQHRLELAGIDKGSSQGGFLGNFAWGSLKLNGDNRLLLAAGGAKTATPALYVGRLVLPGGTGQLANINSNYNIYFDPANPANRAWVGGLGFGSGNGRLLPWSYSPHLEETLQQAGVPLTQDQQAFAAAVDQACNLPHGALANACLSLQALTPAAKKQALAQLTPDQVPAQTGLATQLRLNRLDMPMVRLAALRQGLSAPLALNFNGIALAGGGAGDGDLRDSPLGAFMHARFGFGDQGATATVRGYDFDTRSVVFGADYRFTDRLVAGAMFNYTNTEAHYGQDEGSLYNNGYSGTLYGSYFFPADIYVDWAANYGGQDSSFTRRYSFPGVTGQAKSQPTGSQYGFALNLGRDMTRRGWQFGPYTRFEYASLTVDPYQEQGGAGFAMSVARQVSYSFVSDAGMQVSHAFSLPWAVLTPSIRAEWEHQYLNSNRAIQMNLLDAAPGTGGFVLQTGEPDRDYFNLGGSLVATLPNGGAGFVRFETRLGQANITQHVVEAGVRISF